MELEFKIGNKKAKFVYDKTWARLHLMIGDKKFKTKNVLSFSTTMKYEFDVDKHKVLMEIQRPQFFAGFRGGWIYTAFVDGKNIKSVKD